MADDDYDPLETLKLSHDNSEIDLYNGMLEKFKFKLQTSLLGKLKDDEGKDEKGELIFLKGEIPEIEKQF